MWLLVSSLYNLSLVQPKKTDISRKNNDSTATRVVKWMQITVPEEYKRRLGEQSHTSVRVFIRQISHTKTIYIFYFFFLNLMACWPLSFGTK